MNKIETKRKTENGITLIALVITIIVLLILAGVSIAMLTGQNGILTQAQKAKTETEDSRENELRRLTALEAATNLENTTYEDKNRQTAPIPAGFAVSQVEGENTIEDGLVIIDSKGNEFVWIPVEDESQYQRNRTYPYLPLSETAYTDTGYLPQGIQPIIPEEVTDEQEIGLLNENAERQAVINVGGFYISRYEAGKEGESTLVSKKGATVWANISQTDFKITAKNFINNENVKSALCSGIQWDVIMEFINGKLDGTNKIFNVLEADTNRHIGDVVAKTGNNEADRVCNIYDLEGNCSEYIAERNTYSGAGPIIIRGRDYKDPAAASDRRNYNGSENADISFRIVLYVM